MRSWTCRRCSRGCAARPSSTMPGASSTRTSCGGLAPVPTGEDVPLVIEDAGAPRAAYAISKIAGEAAVRHAGRARGLRWVIGRFHNVYGPRMGADHVIPELSLRALSGEDPFRVWGAEQYRAFCYVDDAVEAMLRLMDCPDAAGEIV